MLRRAQDTLRYSTPVLLLFIVPPMFLGHFRRAWRPCENCAPRWAHTVSSFLRSLGNNRNQHLNRHHHRHHDRHRICRSVGSEHTLLLSAAHTRSC